MTPSTPLSLARVTGTHTDADHNATTSIAAAPDRPTTPDATPGNTPAARRDHVDQTFIFGAGIECSVLPHLNIDQFAWTQHDRQWRDDFRRAVDAGATHLRYAIPWHVMQPERRRFDWAMADERLDAMADLGLEPVMDVMHFGTPLWLKQAVGDVEFPEALEEMTYAMATRYADRVKHWCPVNEPLVCALFAGDFGFWPPHRRKWRGYMPVLQKMAVATSRAIRAVRQAAPCANVIVCDAAEKYQTKFDTLADEVAMRNLRRFVLLDLITGRVDRHHPLFDWLTAYGFGELEIEWLAANPQRPDVLGLDYYPHGDWQLDHDHGRTRQRRADVPAGLAGIARDYHDRYGLPMWVTETSIEGRPINREIWLEGLLDDSAMLRAEGIRLNGLFWWPLVDHLDWDGAMTHRVGKLHQVGLYKLQKQADGTLRRAATPLLAKFRRAAAEGEARVGRLPFVAQPAEQEDPQLPQLAGEGQAYALKQNGQARGKAKAETEAEAKLLDPAPGLAAEPAAATALNGRGHTNGNGHPAPPASPKPPDAGRLTDAQPKATGDFGILVFSHLRWGFVWQRPQQFLSRFARKSPVLFVEEPVFDLPAGREPKLELHRVMPSVTVAVVHAPPGWNTNPRLPDVLREKTREALDTLAAGDPRFDRPLCWYYSPMDADWSLGHFANRGVVYDCMDELSQFSGAPAELVEAEARLIRHADVVFCGGYALGEKKAQQHPNVHTFGCGVETDHFGLAQDENIGVPADIDFCPRPILGFFGVVDERLDYPLLAEVARRRPDWSLCVVGPVVKMDPAHLPHAPNLHWLGGRDYAVLPDYCRAFDVCLMPFAMNKATEFINPTKGLEYMATGRPVVGTPVRDVVRQWSDIVHVADGVEAFIEACERALAEGRQSDRVRRGIELAATKSWEATVATMTDLIAAAINPDDRPSAAKPEARQPSGRAYAFAHTPGS
ncbi:MAG: family 1 glycosylhydrolase [Phycisphaerae bacterium]